MQAVFDPDSSTKCAYIPTYNHYPTAPGSHTEVHQGIAVSFDQIGTISWFEPLQWQICVCVCFYSKCCNNSKSSIEVHDHLLTWSFLLNIPEIWTNRTWNVGQSTVRLVLSKSLNSSWRRKSFIINQQPMNITKHFEESFVLCLLCGYDLNCILQVQSHRNTVFWDKEEPAPYCVSKSLFIFNLEFYSISHSKTGMAFVDFLGLASDDRCMCISCVSGFTPGVCG